MAFQRIGNVRIVGISACVPRNIQDNRNLALLGSEEDVSRFINTTGIIKRHTVGDQKICTSDLCFEAAEKLILKLNWNKEDIDCLIFVSQTPIISFRQLPVFCMDGLDFLKIVLQWISHWVVQVGSMDYQQWQVYYRPGL